MKYELDEKKLSDYGFVNNEYRIDINDSLYVIFKINNSLLEENVYDKFDDSIYIPYRVNTINGSYVSNVRDIVNKYRCEILNKCFKVSDLKVKVMEYCKKKYNTIYETPWDDSPTSYTFKNKGKWYMLMLEVSFKVLGVDKDEVVNIINLKENPNDIDELIDNKNYFRAYHMNKKYWITIVLDNNVDMNSVYELIDKSYQLVDK